MLLQEKSTELYARVIYGSYFISLIAWLIKKKKTILFAFHSELLEMIYSSINFFLLISYVQYLLKSGDIKPCISWMELRQEVHILCWKNHVFLIFYTYYFMLFQCVICCLFYGVTVASFKF